MVFTDEQRAFLIEKLGDGSRFKKLVKKLSAKGSRDPKALAAYIGRKRYGKAKFQQMAAKGRKA